LHVESLVAAKSVGKEAVIELGLVLLGGVAHPSRRATRTEIPAVGVAPPEVLRGLGRGTQRRLGEAAATGKGAKGRGAPALYDFEGGDAGAVADLGEGMPALRRLGRGRTAGWLSDSGAGRG
jgi:hypothetical protein